MLLGLAAWLFGARIAPLRNVGPSPYGKDRAAVLPLPSGRCGQVQPAWAHGSSRERTWPTFAHPRVLPAAHVAGPRSITVGSEGRRYADRDTVIRAAVAGGGGD